jgi:hypothetical protein
MNYLSKIGPLNLSQHLKNPKVSLFLNILTVKAHYISSSFCKPSLRTSRFRGSRDHRIKTTVLDHKDIKNELIFGSDLYLPDVISWWN